MFLHKKESEVYHLFFVDPVTRKRRSVSTETKDFKEARKFKKNFKIPVHEPNKKIKVVLNLSDLQKRILDYAFIKFAPGTVSIYKGTFKKLLIFLKDVPVKSITEADIWRYLTMRIKTVSKSMANIELVNMKAIFNLAIKWDICNNNPAAGITLFSISEKPKGTIESFEYEAILNEIQSDINDLKAKPKVKQFIDLNDFYRLIQFAYLTGCRINEILHISKSSIVLQERVIKVINKPNFKTKTGKSREIPISSRLYVYIVEQLKKNGNVINIDPDSDYLFTNKAGKKLERDYVGKLFKKYVRQANVREKIHFHWIRHTFITRLLKKGIDIYRVAELAGHSDITTTKGYAHLMADDLREAIEML